jgi:hypothetical protein
MVDRQSEEVTCYAIFTLRIIVLKMVFMIYLAVFISLGKLSSELHAHEFAEQL